MTAYEVAGLDQLNRSSERIASQVIEAPLDEFERRTIAKRLLANLLGVGLLGLGVLGEMLVPEHDTVGQLLQAVAALVVAVPILWKATLGFFANPPKRLTEQLVALAVLASIAAGDFVCATLVPLLLEVGHLFEERSALGAQAAIEALRKLCSRRATKLVDDGESDVAPDELVTGDTVVVRPGEVIPVDGVVSAGHANIDQASMTGESRPEEVAPQAEVFAGTLNLDGMLQVTVVKAGQTTVLGQVVRLLQEVEQTKTPIVRTLDRVAGAYLPLVLAIACLALLWSGELSRFVTVLIVACPCAFVLAAPSAMVAAMSMATRHSILIKNASFLEELANVDTLVLDKTGTVTQGTQTVDELLPADGIALDEILAWGAAAARGSRHPASQAILNAAKAHEIVIPEATEIREVPGCGVRATFNGRLIRLGRASWLQESGLTIPQRNTSSGVWVSRDEEVLGFISLFDHARKEAKSAIDRMRGLGFDRVVLLTGDRREVAERVGEELGLDDVIADVLPTEKLDVIRKEQQQGRRVMMVGDGVNDALALSGAEVGVAIGAKVSDVALGGADVALLTCDLERLPLTVEIADLARQIVWENIVIGLAFSTTMLALASAGIVNPLAGALLHNGGAIFVVLNSARLLRTPS